jgi:hypothetical protein
VVRAAGGDISITFCLFVCLSDLQFISRAGIACHWEDNDVVAQEVYYNVRINMIKSSLVSSSEITFSLGLSDMCMYSTCHCLIISNNKYTMELLEIPNCNYYTECFIASLQDLVISYPYHSNLLPHNEWPRLQGNSRRSGSLES